MDSLRLNYHEKLGKGKIVAMVVLDGWGEAKPSEYNCIHLADTPTMDSLRNSGPLRWRLLKAHGKAVGMPRDDDIGSSQIGHNTLGGGRIFKQPAMLVDNALETGKIYTEEAFTYIQESFGSGTLHLIGLLSDGGVHSRLDHLHMFLKGSGERGAKKIRLHILTDGVDALDGSSVDFINSVEKDLANLRLDGVDAKIASGGGRMYVTMGSFVNDWDAVKRGWDAHVLGEAPHKFKCALQAVNNLRKNKSRVDMNFPPFVIVDNDRKAVGPIIDGDAVVTFNFREDGMLMISEALELTEFHHFDRVRIPKIRYAGMLQYNRERKVPNQYLVSYPEIVRTSSEYLAHNGVRTFACSETVKFSHITCSWNGNRSGYFNEENECYSEIRSDRDIDFRAKPKMKAMEIAERASEAILSRQYDQVRVNIPNADMVAHSGDINATIKACAAADDAVKKILDAIQQVGGIFVVTSDHGNAESMVWKNKNGPLVDKKNLVQMLISPTLEPVPISIGGPGLAPGVRFRKDLQEGGLANVAATLINLHGFEAPPDYEPTLIEVVPSRCSYSFDVSLLAILEDAPHDEMVVYLRPPVNDSTERWFHEFTKDHPGIRYAGITERDDDSLNHLPGPSRDHDRSPPSGYILKSATMVVVLVISVAVAGKAWMFLNKSEESVIGFFKNSERTMKRLLSRGILRALFSVNRSL